MKFFRNISLKYKLMVVLVALTSSMLSVYAFLALKDFREDKIAYVFDSNISFSRSLAGQVRSDLDYALDKIQFYISYYNFNEQTFTRTARQNFSQDAYIEQLKTYHEDSSGKSFIGATALPSSNVSFESLAKDLIENVKKYEVTLQLDEGAPGKWIIAVKFKVPGKDKDVVVIARLKKASFTDYFVNAQIQDSFIVRSSEKVLVQPSIPTYSISAGPVLQMMSSLSDQDQKRSLAREVQDEKENDWLMSKVSLGVGELSVISFIPKEAALEAATFLFIKSILFLILLISITVSISVISAGQLTAALIELLSATKNISKGDFNVNLKSKSRDEIGLLANGFNTMAKEIQRLLKETEEKARMENELQTAKVVQSTLFPEPEFIDPKIEVRGYYQPASECGGDWWNYSVIGDKVFLWIGDATGHGVPAALITSAAKSASKILENFPETPLNKLMSMMNSAIHGAAKGEVLMTFFIACYNRKTGEFEYCNASHDPPFVFPKTGEPLKKKHVVPLMDSTGSRLGENPSSEYEVCSYKLSPGDRIVFYTDGLTELLNTSDELWGERRFLRQLMKSFNAGPGIESTVPELNAAIDDYRAGAPLADDVTYFSVLIK